MTHRLTPLLGALLLGLGGCAVVTVKPSPTADQIIAVQLGARSDHGEMSGTESSTISDAYRQEIGRSVPKSSSPLSGSPENSLTP